MIFVDLTKAHGNAWLDTITYAMHKEGLDIPERI